MKARDLASETKRYLRILAAATAVTCCAFGAPLRNLPVEYRQPDGSVIHCFLSGDEFHHWLHDEKGFTITRDPQTGYFVYAKSSDGALVPTPFRPGIDDPRLAGLAPYQRPYPVANTKLQRKSQYARVESITGYSPTKGTLNNIVIFARFAGDGEWSDPLSVYESMFNSANAGTNSLYNYFREVSYGQLILNSTFYPTQAGGTVVSCVDSHPQGYYEPYSTTNPIGYTTDAWEREQEFVTTVTNAIKAQVPGNIDLDVNHDGQVDVVTIIAGGDGPIYGDIFHPHKVGFNTGVMIGGKEIVLYNMEQRYILNYGYGGGGVGTLAHEILHIMGFPDMYQNGSLGVESFPLGYWDPMCGTNGPPAHVTAYMKQKYGGWISSIDRVSASGRYSLNPLTSQLQNAYVIPSPNSSMQYFIAEYRRKSGIFESSLPGEGLLVYRVDPEGGGPYHLGNYLGPPYELYAYRPGGDLSTIGSLPDAAFSLGVGRTLIDDWSNPSSFLSDGSPGGLKIGSIGPIGEHIQFSVGGFPAADISWESAGLSGSDVRSVLVHTDGYCFAGVYNGGIYRSTDDGQSWARVWANNVSVQALMSHNTNEVYAGTGSGIYRSTDNGNSWNLRGLNGYSLQALATNVSGYLFAGTSSAVYRSTDGGGSWSQVLSVTALRSIVTNMQGHIFVGAISNGGLWRSTDDGDSWSQVGNGVGNNVYSIAIQRSGSVFTGYMFLYQSNDNGDNFSVIPTTPGPTPMRAMKVNSVGHLFVGTLSGVYRSTNNGANWAAINNGLGNTEVWGLSQSLDGHIYAATAGGVFRTGNGVIAPTTANVKVLLEGPYSSGTMSVALNTNGYIPLPHPYGGAPYNHSGTESAVAIPAGTIDWVFLELRSGTAQASKVGSRAAFLKSDGTIVDLDGASQVSFAGVPAGSYYLVVRHRNHLAVMSATATALSSSSSALYDFTTGTDKYYGGVAKALAGGKFGMFAGNNDGDGLVTVLDYNAVGSGLFTAGYWVADHDMDGLITVLDYNPVGANLFTVSNVP